MHVLTSLRRRITSEERGFTLIELLVVLVIIGVLLAIAVPSYLGFKQRAEKQASNANVRSAIPAAEAYYSDNDTYAGMDLPALQAIDQGVSLVSVSVTGGGTGWTLTSTVGNCTATATGPAGGGIANSCT
jgi:prepilin-type N-terminal cleavage/methylation domain-containing protein